MKELNPERHCLLVKASSATCILVSIASI